MLEISESLLWSEGHTPWSLNTGLPNTADCQTLHPSYSILSEACSFHQGWGRGLLLPRSNLAYFVELHFSSNEIASVAQFLAVFYLGISLCGSTDDHRQEDVERVVITIKKI
jgi:hypothetical protein